MDGSWMISRFSRMLPEILCASPDSPEVLLAFSRDSIKDLISDTVLHRSNTSLHQVMLIPTNFACVDFLDVGSSDLDPQFTLLLVDAHQA